MKTSSVLTLILILIITGGLAYGIIWYIGKDESDLDENSGTGDNGNSLPNDNEPSNNDYDWWVNKIGHASFPLKMGSRGIEVLKMQEEMNWQVAQKNWDVDPISEDGIWGLNTQNRFKLLYPGYDRVDEGMFAMAFGELAS